MRSPALIPMQILCFSFALQLLPATVEAQIVPGTGRKLIQVGDDFEDEKWTWNQNGAKASREQDEQTRPPMGASANRRWFESPKRGQPDHIIRVETPPGGLTGSRGALKIQTLNSGVPGLNSMQMEQDDLIMSCSSRVGMISAARGPSCLTRIWLPPFDQWEDRSGSHNDLRKRESSALHEKRKEAGRLLAGLLHRIPQRPRWSLSQRRSLPHYPRKSPGTGNSQHPARAGLVDTGDVRQRGWSRALLCSTRC